MVLGAGFYCESATKAAAVDDRIVFAVIFTGKIVGRLCV
jgi:hypothetical protein